MKRRSVQATVMIFFVVYLLPPISTSRYRNANIFRPHRAISNAAQREERGGVMGPPGRLAEARAITARFRHPVGPASSPLPRRKLGYKRLEFDSREALHRRERESGLAQSLWDCCVSVTTSDRDAALFLERDVCRMHRMCANRSRSKSRPVAPAEVPVCIRSAYAMILHSPIASR